MCNFVRFSHFHWCYKKQSRNKTVSIFRKKISPIVVLYFRMELAKFFTLVLLWTFFIFCINWYIWRLCALLLMCKRNWHHQRWKPVGYSSWTSRQYQQWNTSMSCFLRFYFWTCCSLQYWVQHMLWETVETFYLSVPRSLSSLK